MRASGPSFLSMASHSKYKKHIVPEIQSNSSSLPEFEGDFRGFECLESGELQRVRCCLKKRLVEWHHSVEVSISLFLYPNRIYIYNFTWWVLFSFEKEEPDMNFVIYRYKRRGKNRNRKIKCTKRNFFFDQIFFIFIFQFFFFFNILLINGGWFILWWWFSSSA